MIKTLAIQCNPFLVLLNIELSLRCKSIHGEVAVYNSAYKRILLEYGKPPRGIKSLDCLNIRNKAYIIRIYRTIVYVICSYQCLG